MFRQLLVDRASCPSRGPLPLTFRIVTDELGQLVIETEHLDQLDETGRPDLAALDMVERVEQGAATVAAVVLVLLRRGRRTRRLEGELGNASVTCFSTRVRSCSSCRPLQLLPVSSLTFQPDASSSTVSSPPPAVKTVPIHGPSPSFLKELPQPPAA